MFKCVHNKNMFDRLKCFVGVQKQHKTTVLNYVIIINKVQNQVDIIIDQLPLRNPDSVGLIILEMPVFNFAKTFVELLLLMLKSGISLSLLRILLSLPHFLISFITPRFIVSMSFFYLKLRTIGVLYLSKNVYRNLLLFPGDWSDATFLTAHSSSSIIQL